MTLNLLIPAQVTETGLYRLMDLARRVPADGNIVEVGSLYGLSSWRISKPCQAGVTLFHMDPWEEQSGPLIASKSHRMCRLFPSKLSPFHQGLRQYRDDPGLKPADRPRLEVWYRPLW
ncbi:MAG: hypothetical protein ING02_13265 [Roseomonas sp.]|nr:hypothetical protein [Roseomonas sp.]